MTKTLIKINLRKERVLSLGFQYIVERSWGRNSSRNCLLVYPALPLTKELTSCSHELFLPRPKFSKIMTPETNYLLIHAQTISFSLFSDQLVTYTTHLNYSMSSTWLVTSPQVYATVSSRDRALALRVDLLSLFSRIPFCWVFHLLILPHLIGHGLFVLIGDASIQHIRDSIISQPKKCDRNHGGCWQMAGRQTYVQQAFLQSSG